MNILQKKYYEYRYRNLFNVEEVLNVKIPKIIEFNNNLLGNSVIEPITEFSICNCIDLLRSISDAYILSIFSQIHIIPYTFVSSHNNISDDEVFNIVGRTGSYIIRHENDSTYYHDEYLGFFFNYKRVFNFIIKEEAFLYL